MYNRSKKTIKILTNFISKGGVSMQKPILSELFQTREPSDVRLAQMKYAERKVKPEAVVNVGIGNVSLPTNPAMQKKNV